MGLLATLLLAACGGPPAAGRIATDDRALHEDIAQGRSGAEVTLGGVVVSGPVIAGREQEFSTRTPLGDVVEVDHDIDYSTQAPVRVGDKVIVRGQLYLDPGRAGVHCTHQSTSSGCPVPGFVEVGGSLYE
ncbi:MAG: hypothetical protein ACREQM_01155 [Candidatus Dormibacteraceae bacterium]